MPGSPTGICDDRANDETVKAQSQMRGRWSHRSGVLMDTNTDTIQVGDLFAVAALPFIVGLLFWVFLALMAAAVAPEGRRMVFFFCTFFFLGPLGLHAA